MLSTVDLLNLAKEHQGGVSDYRIAKMLGVSATIVSNYRCKRSTPANPTAMRLGELCGIDPLAAVVHVNYERTHTDGERHVWLRMLERLEGVRPEELPGLQRFLSPKSDILLKS